MYREFFEIPDSKFEIPEVISRSRFQRSFPARDSIVISLEIA
jgi:hypothetical protein